MTRHRIFAALAALCLVVSVSALAFYKFDHLLPAKVAEPLGLRADIAEIRKLRGPELRAAMADAGLEMGAPVFIRIFKEESLLEVFVKSEDRYHLFRSYPICAYSGTLGPKLKEGDGQAPEGFYTVTRTSLNPNSNFHLSFNLGFPNAFDRAQGRTGSFLMVHGACVSVGCYAMTDPLIEEIYLIVESALENGQPSVPVHAFPFRMTSGRMQTAVGHQWFDFWADLAPAYEHFENHSQVPSISLSNGRYLIAMPEG